MLSQDEAAQSRKRAHGPDEAAAGTKKPRKRQAIAPSKRTQKYRFETLEKLENALQSAIDHFGTAKAKAPELEVANALDVLRQWQFKYGQRAGDDSLERVGYLTRYEDVKPYKSGQPESKVSGDPQPDVEFPSDDDEVRDVLEGDEAMLAGRIDDLAVALKEKQDALLAEQKKEKTAAAAVEEEEAGESDEEEAEEASGVVRGTVTDPVVVHMLKEEFIESTMCVAAAEEEYGILQQRFGELADKHGVEAGVLKQKMKTRTMERELHLLALASAYIQVGSELFSSWCSEANEKEEALVRGLTPFIGPAKKNLEQAAVEEPESEESERSKKKKKKQKKEERKEKKRKEKQAKKKKEAPSDEENASDSDEDFFGQLNQSQLKANKCQYHHVTLLPWCRFYICI